MTGIPPGSNFDPQLDIADAQQAFIEGIQEAIDKRILRPEESAAIAIGRCMTIMMEAVDELRQMQNDPDLSLVQRENAKAIADTYRGFVAGFQRQITAIMAKSNRIIRIR